MFTKTLITSVILDRFMDNYSDDEYRLGWEKLQKFIEDYKDDKRLYSESSFDSEWLDEIFCDILGYPKKLKSREYNVTNAVGKKEERIDGVFYEKDLETVKMVIELKALDTKDLFKKRGNLSPITQCAKYLFQTPSSELAVVSNFDHIVIFDKKEEFRQSWVLFDMTYEQFKEFYLVLHYNSFYSHLTKLMIDQSESSEKDIDNGFYLLASSIHKSLHNKFKKEYASDLFNKFIAMAILEDSALLPPLLIKTVYNRKTDFDHSLRSHWEVFKTFFQTMKKNKAGRMHLGIDDDKIPQMPVWQDTSYLGRITVPKSILDQLVSLSEYNLKSVPLDVLFFTMTKKIYNPYNGVDFYEDDETLQQFKFYSEFLRDEYAPLDVCLSFATKDIIDPTHPIIELYNQIDTNNPVVKSRCIRPFTLDSGLTYKTYKGEWYSIINKIDLDDEDIVKSIIKNLDSVNIVDIDDEQYAVLGFTENPTTVLHIFDGTEVSMIQRKDINSHIHILSAEEKEWIDEFEINSKPFSKFGLIVDKEDADFQFNLTTGEIIEKDEFGNWVDSFEWYDEKETQIFIKSKFDDLMLIMLSDDFIKYLRLNDCNSLSCAVISDRLLDEEFIKESKAKKKIKDSITLYEYKLDKLKENNSDEIEIMRIEMQLDNLYEKENMF